MNAARNVIIGLALIGLAIAGVGAYLAYANFEKVKAVESWPTVPGYVVESTIVWDVQASPSSSRTQSHSYCYRLKVRTDYKIDSHYFSNTTPGINEISDQKYFKRDPWKNLPDEDMIRLFKQVPQGMMVSVHYNPGDKAESYIFSELPFWDLYGTAFFLILFGAIFLFFPLGTWIWLSKKNLAG